MGIPGGNRRALAARQVAWGFRMDRAKGPVGLNRLLKKSSYLIHYGP